MVLPLLEIALLSYDSVFFLITWISSEESSLPVAAMFSAAKRQGCQGGTNGYEQGWPRFKF